MKHSAVSGQHKAVKACHSENPPNFFIVQKEEDDMI